jgi:hypothetical protein
VKLALTLVGLAVIALASFAGSQTATAATTPGPAVQPAVLAGKVPVCSYPVEGFSRVGGPNFVLWVSPYEPCPGPPAEIKSLTETERTVCGASDLLTFDVTDALGYNVADGTEVRFTTTLGQVQASTGTKGGLAQVSLLSPPRTSGIAEIEAAAGAARTNKTLEVTC